MLSTAMSLAILFLALGLIALGWVIVEWANDRKGL